MTNHTQAHAEGRAEVEMIRRLVLPMVEQRSREKGDAWDQAANAILALLDSPAPAGVRIKPLNDWIPVANADFRNWGPWIWHGEKSQRPAHIRVSLNNEEGTDVAIYLTENGSGWGRNYSPDWSEITWYRLRNNHPYYMAALEPAPAGVTVPDELYQAAKRDAEEAEAYAEELEAKLVETICLARDAINGLVDSGDAFEALNATLQEIKGEKDD
jgi:hypothetical protein